MDIMSPPVITHAPSVYHKPIGSRIRFYCVATGMPQPQIRWLHDGIPATIDDFHSHMIDNDYVISQLWWEDKGIYQCEAKNDAGSAVVTAAVTINKYDDKEYPSHVTNLTISSISSLRMRVTWDPPDYLPGPVIAYHLYCRAKQEYSRVIEKVVYTLSFELTDLEPFTEYWITVQCFTEKAPCPRFTKNVTTAQDVPSGSPEFSLASESPTTITVTWDRLLRYRANGIIISYGITYCRVAPPVITHAPSVYHKPIGSRIRFYCVAAGNAATRQIRWLHDGIPATIDDFHSHMIDNDYVISQLWWEDKGIYQCEAKNDAGSAVVTAAVTINKYDDKEYPSHVTNLTISSISSRRMRVTWDPPDYLPGPVIAYHLYCRAKQEYSRVIEKVVYTLSFELTDLEPFTEYWITVQCFTEKAPCPRFTKNVTTAQDVPSGSPEFSLASESPTTITVTWDRLLRYRANGIIISYGITYCRVGSVYCNITMVEGNLQEYTLHGLTPNSNYSVSMAATTEIGQGRYSGNGTVATPRNINETTPKPPLHLQVVPVNHTTLRVSFQPAPTPPIIEGYKLMVSLNLANDWATFLLPLDTMEYYVTGLGMSS
nr:protogenin A-like [Lytechinus pictus]